MAVACYLLSLEPPSLSPGWLTPDEIQYLEVCQLASNDHSGHHKSFEKRIILSVFLNWRMHFLIFASWSNAVPNYALKFSMPEIIKSMGYESVNAQLLTINSDNVDEERPRYSTGYGTSIAFAAVGIVACLSLEFCLWNGNKKKDMMTVSEIEGKHTKHQLRKMEERSPLFKYSL
ncbi:hypothetical protein PENCOP_c002G04651 [Penicillium coprophilum]|uniref:Major facilitator superfamily (MFS) profile domain-containing protein n=1 Tax=Penicillium coprophilum TaxID=36646 RepID=A0A1V6V132_9EURO|nr:hypothetical protein PENCOP_c002G04651 [Penicillium coprophilum]